MANEYARLQLEDKALKSAGMYFGQELLPYFKIKKRILRMLPTEQIRLEAIRQLEGKTSYCKGIAVHRECLFDQTG